MRKLAFMLITDHLDDDLFDDHLDKTVIDYCVSRAECRACGGLLAEVAEPGSSYTKSRHICTGCKAWGAMLGTGIII
jgi:hypothetical protein